MKAMALQPGCQEGFVEVDGALVRYLHAGDGEPMLLIHGLVGSSQNWRNNMHAFAERSSVYAIDLLNMGKSQRVGGLDPGLAATARRIVAVMDALRICSSDIVAHSHGGAVALMLAALHPERVHRLVLFSPANPYCHSSDPVVLTYSTLWGGFALRLLPYLPTPIQRAALGIIYGGSDQVLDHCLLEIVESLRNPVTLRHVLSIIRCWFSERAKLKAALRRLKRRTMLLVWGERDYTVSLRSGIKLQQKLHAADLIVVPDGSHAVFEEQARETNRIVINWLDCHPWLARRKRRTAKIISISKAERDGSAMGPLRPETES